MDAIIQCIDKRCCTGYTPTFLKNTTFEEILSFFKKHKNATSVFLLKSPKHENGGAFYKRNEYLKYIEQALAKAEGKEE